MAVIKSGRRGVRESGLPGDDKLAVAEHRHWLPSVKDWGLGLGVSEMCSGSEAGSYLRLIDSCITQLKAQGPVDGKEEEKKWGANPNPNLDLNPPNTPVRVSTLTGVPTPGFDSRICFPSGFRVEGWGGGV